MLRNMLLHYLEFTFEKVISRQVETNENQMNIWIWAIRECVRHCCHHRISATFCAVRWATLRRALPWWHMTARCNSGWLQVAFYGSPVIIDQTNSQRRAVVVGQTEPTFVYRLPQSDDVSHVCLRECTKCRPSFWTRKQVPKRYERSCRCCCCCCCCCCYQIFHSLRIRRFSTDLYETFHTY